MMTMQEAPIVLEQRAVCQQYADAVAALSTLAAHVCDLSASDGLPDRLGAVGQKIRAAASDLSVLEAEARRTLDQLIGVIDGTQEP